MSDTETVTPERPPHAPEPPAPTPKWRWPILAVNVLLVAATAGWVANDPKVGQLQAYKFPETVELEAAKFTTSDRLKPVKKPEYEGSSYIAGRHYQYRDRARPIDIEIRYVVDTEGGVDKFTREHSHIADSTQQEDLIAQVTSIDDVGHHALLTYDDKTYISSCINPRGRTTTSPEQYARNQELYDTVLERVGVWMFGRQRWRDDRCLWTLMYTPTGDDPEASAEQLEAAWVEWAGYWQENFPPL